MSALMILFVASGLLVAGLSVPMILGKIPPNGLYGFRVKKTMENPQVWYAVNTYSGKWLLFAHLVFVLAAVGLYFVPNLSLDMYAYAVLGVWVAAFGVAIIASVRYLKSL
jgi:hypothetical protein